MPVEAVVWPDRALKRSTRRAENTRMLVSAFSKAAARERE